LDEVTQLLSSINSTFVSAEAPRQLNISPSHAKELSMDIKYSTTNTLPTLESIFNGAQEQAEKLLASDIYPRFVKHQVTTSATLALSGSRERFAGLGDCFCLTDPG